MLHAGNTFLNMNKNSSNTHKILTHIFSNFTAMKFWISLILGLSFVQIAFSQGTNPDGITRYYYPNGQISAEGTLKEGKPDGYWKNYYEDGTLKSEGNRKYFELDSIWKFYYPDGKLSETITYRQDKKNGYTQTYDYFYDEDSVKHHYLVSKELYVNGLREGTSFYYDISGYVKYTFSYKSDKRSGDGQEFDKNGLVITMFRYHNGYEVETIRVNRRDDQGRKQGKWMEFYPSGSKMTEYNYLNGVLHGYFREFDINGKILNEKRYVNGELYVPKVEEEIKLKAEIKKSFYPDGTLQFEGAFVDTVPVGIHKEYDKSGKIITAKEYTAVGELLGQGLFDKNGSRSGIWKLYDIYNSYFFAEGNYLNGLKDGKWIFYYPDGKTELEGYFSEDKPDREWLWLYPNGNKKREEVYMYGKREGLYVEYDSVGNEILKGEYFDDARNGEWIYQVGDIVEQGTYELDERTGQWKHYYDTGKIRFEGKYKNGDADGVHKWYFPDGTVELVGEYRIGKKHKDWKKFNEDGSLYMTFTYRNDELIKIDGKNLQKGKGKK